MFFSSCNVRVYLLVYIISQTWHTENMTLCNNWIFLLYNNWILSNPALYLLPCLAFFLRAPPTISSPRPAPAPSFDATLNPSRLSSNAFLQILLPPHLPPSRSRPLSYPIPSCMRPWQPLAMAPLFCPSPAAFTVAKTPKLPVGLYTAWLASPQIPSF